jgi:chromosome segregation ATPase
MTKQQLQKELLERVKEGVKPSQLKKSRSLDNLNSQIPKPPLNKSKSAEALETSPKLTLNSLAEENQHLKAQTKIKQGEIEGLREKLEETNSKLTQAQSKLDNSLLARHQNLKDFSQIHSQKKQAWEELVKVEEEASEELISHEEKISQLRTENARLKLVNQNLERDLGLSQRLLKLKEFDYEPNFNQSLTYFKYGVYLLLAV